MASQIDADYLTPPTSLLSGVPFPPNFKSTVKSILRRLFRVYAHIYNHHFAHVCALSVEAHLNTSYRHFLLFVTEFDLVDPKELAPLVELNEAILEERSQSMGASGSAAIGAQGGLPSAQRTAIAA